MQIKMIETYSTKDLCMVRVCTDQGDGWGMAAPYSADITALALHRHLAPFMLGKEAEDFQELQDEMNRTNHIYKFFGSYLIRALAGFDTAMWDYHAKQAGKSVADYIGRKTTEPIKLYGSSMRRCPNPLESEAERLVSIWHQCGFEAFKLHPGIPNGQDRDFYPGCTEEFVRVVRKAFPDSIKLYVDVNGNFSVERAIEFAHFLKEQNVTFYEEPVPYWRLKDLVAVQRACQEIGMPIANGEQDFINSHWSYMLDNRAMDIVQPDLLYCGGFTRALRIAKKAAEKGLTVTPHTANQTPLFVYSLNYMSVIETPYEYLECGVENYNWENAAYLNPPKIENGKASILDGPGWGVQLNQDWLARSTYQVSKH